LLPRLNRVRWWPRWRAAATRWGPRKRVPPRITRRSGRGSGPAAPAGVRARVGLQADSSAGAASALRRKLLREVIMSGTGVPLAYIAPIIVLTVRASGP